MHILNADMFLIFEINSDEEVHPSLTKPLMK